MSEQINIPELRFPGFHGEWKNKRIKELVEIKYGRDQKSIACENGKFPILGTGGEIGRTNEYIYNKPSVLIGRKGTIDNPKYIDTPFWTVDTLFYTEVFDSTIAKWLFYKLGTINWYLYNEASGVPSLSSSTIYNISITTPSLPEQQKIASFFTAIDRKISQLKQKKTLLEQYKKGVMQKIFSQEIRFRDDNGQEFPMWEKKRLGEISERNQNKNKKNTETKVLTNSAVNGIVLQSEYFDKNIANQNNLLNYYIVEIDDFVYNPRISVHAPVGPIKRNHIGIGVMSPLYSVFKFTEGLLDFFELFFSTTHWHEYMKSIANYGARSDRMNITTKDLYNMPIPFPSLAEQAKIANFLSSIDNKINHTQIQIEKAELWKKGLLQKMFV